MPQKPFALPGQSLQPQDYKFNEKTSWPEHVNTHVEQFLNQNHGKQLAWNQHANDRSKLDDGSHGVDIGSIPGLSGKFPTAESGWRPVEVEHDGKQLKKVVMRGPYNDTHDAVLPIIPSQSGPVATTAWKNSKDDEHNTLDLNRVHLPEEFKPGKQPRRRLMSREDTLRPGYQAVPHHRMKSRQRIVQQFGWPSSGPSESQQQVAYYLPNLIDFSFLKKALKRFK
jgi:hypothetical protein